MTRFLLAVVVSLAIADASAHAAIILGNTFDGNTGTEAEYLNGQVTAPNVYRAGVSRVGYSLLVGENELVVGDLRTQDGSIAGSTRYFEFIIEPTNDSVIDLESFTYVGNQNVDGEGVSGATKFALRSSLDLFREDIGVANLTGTTISLADPKFQNITTYIDFRLYIQSDTSGESQLTTYSLQEFAFNGSVTAIPEPSSMALLAIGGAGLAWRRRKSNKTLV
ncbi:hypothetical protein RISK_001174 [Rhodopirellula islandica]|uniref:Ice-binding protein C-terminal domain-containing protein n=1 Tax=Rhodopirellula islandica TaxID=595434 RepID=A0A0J1BJY2_RHOIS|nr:PEP-CTERM sorting domain-containing protein [Rhodopirellula islandica]KLU06860.1 hypothetical protein RISK_001174 [Rhodopirellula islandica]